MLDLQTGLDAVLPLLAIKGSACVHERCFCLTHCVQVACTYSMASRHNSFATCAGAAVVQEAMTNVKCCNCADMNLELVYMQHI